jgi:subtilisin family serine protease
MTTDPDGDSLTDDALDVVNMSLGRRPDPEEPLSQAVNNAVLRGVTFVIAAGNDYNFQSIGTPGIAEHAITVGAVDQNRFTAYFSSKGPVENTFLLKPDVAAPGVDIYSSILNGQYSHYSGTSMGTAHVSGVAALLLEKHPTWTPAMIKSSLMTTATSMQAQVWEQGAGVIDALGQLITVPKDFTRQPRLQSQMHRVSPEISLCLWKERYKIVRSTFRSPSHFFLYSQQKQKQLKSI